MDWQIASPNPTPLDFVVKNASKTPVDVLWQAIATLTLFGGFASTACWPLSAYLALPLYVLALPRRVSSEGPLVRAGSEPGHLPAIAADANRPSRPLFLLLAATITLGSVVSALVSVHLLSILQGPDVAQAEGQSGRRDPAEWHGGSPLEEATE